MADSSQSNTAVSTPIAARISKDRQRWLCGNRLCPAAAIATLGRDEKGSYLLLPAGFDRHPTKGHYFFSHRPARRFNRPEIKDDGQPRQITEIREVLLSSHNTDVQIRLRVVDLPAVLCCARCGVFSRIRAIAA